MTREVITPEVEEAPQAVPYDRELELVRVQARLVLHQRWQTTVIAVAIVVGFAACCHAICG